MRSKELLKILSNPLGPTCKELSWLLAPEDLGRQGNELVDDHAKLVGSTLNVVSKKQ